MNKFEFLLNLDQYRNYKPKNVLYHDSYDIPKKETHKIQPGYSRAPKIYKDQISLYEEYNNEVIAHRGDMKYYQKIENFYGPGKSRYFYSKEEWDAYQEEKNKMINKAKAEVNAREVKEAQSGRNNAIKNSNSGSREVKEAPDNFLQIRRGAIMEGDRAIERSLKEGGMKAGINAILRDERMDEFFTQFEGGFENYGWELTEDDKIKGMSDDDQKYVKDIENWARKFTDSEGNSLFESKDFQDAVMKEIKNRYEKAQKYKELDEIGKGGNVDLSNRPEISTKELIKAGWDVDDDDYATVYTTTYSNEGDTEFYNFTPIIVDPKTGKFLGVMSPKEFDEYCWDVIDGKRDDDYNLQIGGAFTGKNAFKRAGDAAMKIHELHEELHELNKKSK